MQRSLTVYAYLPNSFPCQSANRFHLLGWAPARPARLSHAILPALLWQMAPPMLRREFIFSQPDNYRQEARLRTQIQNDIISAFLVFPPPLTLNFVTSPLHCSQLLVFPTILFHAASLQSCGQLTPLCEATDNQIPLSIKLTDWDIFPCTLWFFQLNPTHQVDP